MNSLEAILTITALLFFITILLVGLTNYKNTLNETQNFFSSKINSNACATIIDSFYSNNAEEYTKNFPCFGENNLVYYKKNNFLGKSFVITDINKEKTLEVKTSEHYQ